MSFFDDLLSDSLIVAGASGRGKSSPLVAGIVCLAAASALLFFYLSWEPAAVAAYHVEEVSYTRCYYDDKSDYKKIVLVSGGKEYRLEPYLWQDRYDADVVVDELSRHGGAKVWLRSEGEVFVKGIETPTLSIDPAVGAAWDRSNRKALLWLIVGAFLLGSSVLVIAVLP